MDAVSGMLLIAFFAPFAWEVFAWLFRITTRDHFARRATREFPSQ